MVFSDYWFTAGGGPGPGPIYSIGNSLRFRGAQYLTNENGVIFPDNTDMRYILSFWMKPSQMTGNTTNVVFGRPYGSNASQWFVKAQQFGRQESSNTKYFQYTRDPSAWYHVFIKCTTEAYNLPGEGFVWINGVVVPSSKNQLMGFHKGQTAYRIGARAQGAAALWYEGYLADFHLLTGPGSNQNLTVDDFGLFNDNGIWVPKALPNGTNYGLLGSHLTFADPDNLGEDTAPVLATGHTAANDFTPTGFNTDPVGIFSNQATATPGGFRGTDPATNMFDGSLSTRALADQSDAIITFEPNPALAFTNGVHMNVNHTTASPGEFRVTVDGATGAWTTFPNPQNSSSGLVNTVATGAGSLEKIEVRRTDALLPAVIAIGLNGTATTNILTDNTGADYDLMQDSPTQNYATLNPLISTAGTNIADANLEWSAAATNQASQSIALPTEGNYYFEATLSASNALIGITQVGDPIDRLSVDEDVAVWLQNFNAGSAANATRTPNSTLSAGAATVIATPCVLGVEWDATAGTFEVFRNGVSQYTVGTITLAGPYYLQVDRSSTNATTVNFNFGQQPFVHRPAAIGDDANLQTQNLPAAPIANGRDHFQAITGGGQGLGTWSEPNTNSINSPVDITNATSGPFYTLPVTPANQRNWIHDFGFPQASVTHTHLTTVTGLTYALSEDGTNWTVVDNNYTVTANVEITSTAAENGGNNVRYVRLYHPTTTWGIGLSAASGDTPILQAAQNTFPNGLWWIKDRVNANQHQFVDSLRGGNLALQSPTVAAETAYVAPSGDAVAWCWNAGGAAVTNNDGTLESQVSANPEAGFSIVSYTGTGTAGETVGHGLNSAPEFLMIKSRETAHNWAVYHSEVDATAPEDFFLILNSNAVRADDVGRFNDTAPSNTVFTVGNSVTVNNNGRPFIAYAWHSVPGYSAFGTYTGNGNADGSFIYTGFKIAVLIVKAIDSAQHWMTFDSTRYPFNTGGATPALAPSETSNETTVMTNANQVDFLSNGFKWRQPGAGSRTNATNVNYVYAAFAENPFQAPATAR